jgi:hypothetical protein
MKKFFPTLSIRQVVAIALASVTAAGTMAQPPRSEPDPHILSQLTIRRQSPTPTRPKIVIGLVVDQMRWDYLTRFRDRYGPGGFRRLTAQGFSCDNAMIDYSPSVTACGHTCVYTGSVPAVTGVMGNDWYDRCRHKKVYCTEDTTVALVGTAGIGTVSAGGGVVFHGAAAGGMSPANLLTTTIGDEMNKADNFRSKVVGIALKDRAAILPAGHTATAAFWYDDKTGHFISSTYYMQELPPWAQQFDAAAHGTATPRRATADSGWKTLYPLNTYIQSEPAKGFPHHNAIRTTPFGSALTLDFAKAAIEGYGLGSGRATDLLAISLSSPDAIGHQYGPNSVETEDTYLRLDRDIAAFLTWLDGRFGKGNYLFFLTADHGVTSSPAYALEHRMPGGAWDPARIMAELNDSLAAKFQLAGGVESITEFQLYLNRKAFEQKGVNLATAEAYIAGLAVTLPGIAEILSEASLATAPLPPALKDRLIDGYNSRLSGDMVILPEPGWKTGGLNGADHGLPYPDDIHIPLLFFGWKIAPGHISRRVNMTDIAPTLAALLGVQMPGGCIGQPIAEITR